MENFWDDLQWYSIMLVLLLIVVAGTVALVYILKGASIFGANAIALWAGFVGTFGALALLVVMIHVMVDGRKAKKSREELEVVE